MRAVPHPRQSTPLDPRGGIQAAVNPNLKIASFGPAGQTGVDDALAARALAHPIRARVLELLAQAPGSPRELSLGLDAPLTTVSYHVRTLCRLGFIELLETVPRRGTLEHRYRAVARVRMVIERL